MRELLGVGLMACAVACFAAMDNTTKLLVASVPAVMAVWARSLMQLTVVSATLLPRRGRSLLHTRRPRWQALRGVLLLGTMLCGYLGIRALPVGEFTAIVLLTPVALTVVSALAGGERVPLLRWLCLGAGLGGALLVIRPGGRGSLGLALLALAIVALNTGYQWVTSRLARLEDPGTTQFYSGALGTVLATALLPFAWQALPAADWALLAVLGLLGTAGHLLLSHAYGLAPVSRLSPFLYLQIAFAAFGSWLLFSHAPDGWATAGVLLIGASGVAAATLDRPRNTAR